MISSRWILAAFACCLCLGAFALFVAAEENQLAPEFDASAIDPSAMTEATQKAMTTTEEHEMLVGEWDAEITPWCP